MKSRIEAQNDERLKRRSSAVYKRSVQSLGRLNLNWLSYPKEDGIYSLVLDRSPTSEGKVCLPKDWKRCLNGSSEQASTIRARDEKNRAQLSLGRLNLNWLSYPKEYGICSLVLDRSPTSEGKVCLPKDWKRCLNGSTDNGAKLEPRSSSKSRKEQNKLSCRQKRRRYRVGDQLTMEQSWSLEAARRAGKNRTSSAADKKRRRYRSCSNKNSLKMRTNKLVQANRARSDQRLQNRRGTELKSNKACNALNEMDTKMRGFVVVLVEDCDARASGDSALSFSLSTEWLATTVHRLGVDASGKGGRVGVLQLVVALTQLEVPQESLSWDKLDFFDHTAFVEMPPRRRGRGRGSFRMSLEQQQQLAQQSGRQRFRPRGHQFKKKSGFGSSGSGSSSSSGSRAEFCGFCGGKHP
ncbi:hypothetical protein F511_25314 [Dorcoceras hygrometricum]|uniref:Uncharacterized protein n=1 Tax=Dorcoceras hygrometricum TaxID=472368 RepID=A0A2Z7AN70_9LAMI|nr:hypothetical protein F511_25314 [Dorcoceras hygrometricum]